MFSPPLPSLSGTFQAVGTFLSTVLTALRDGPPRTTGEAPASLPGPFSGGAAPEGERASQTTTAPASAATTVSGPATKYQRGKRQQVGIAGIFLARVIRDEPRPGPLRDGPGHETSL